MVNSNPTDPSSSSSHKPPTVADVVEEDEDIEGDDRTHPTEFSGLASDIGGSVPTNDGRNPLSSESDDQDVGYINHNLPNLNRISGPRAPNPPPPSRRHRQSRGQHQPQPPRITIRSSEGPRAAPQSRRQSTFSSLQDPAPYYTYHPQLTTSEDYSYGPYYPTPVPPPVPWGQMVHGGNFVPPPPPPQPATPPAERQITDQILEQEKDVQDRLQSARTLERLKVELEMSKKIATLRDEMRQEINKLAKREKNDDRLEMAALRKRISELENHGPKGHVNNKLNDSPVAFVHDADALKRELESQIREELAKEARAEAEMRHRELQLRIQIETELKAKVLLESQMEELSRLRIEHRVQAEVDEVKRRQEERDRYQEEAITRAKLDAEKNLAAERKSFELKMAEASAQMRVPKEEEPQLLPARQQSFQWNPRASVMEVQSDPGYRESVFRFQTEGPKGPIYFYGISQSDSGVDITGEASLLGQPQVLILDSDNYSKDASEKSPAKRRRRRGQRKKSDKQSIPSQESQPTLKSTEELPTFNSITDNHAQDNTDDIITFNMTARRSGPHFNMGTTESSLPIRQRVLRSSQTHGDDFDSDDMDNIPPSHYMDSDEESIPDQGAQGSGATFVVLPSSDRTLGYETSIAAVHGSSESLRSLSGSLTVSSSEKTLGRSYSKATTDSGYGSEANWHRSGEQGADMIRKLEGVPRAPSPPMHPRVSRPYQTRKVHSISDTIHRLNGEDSMERPATPLRRGTNTDFTQVDWESKRSTNEREIREQSSYCNSDTNLAGRKRIHRVRNLVPRSIEENIL